MERSVRFVSTISLVLMLLLATVAIANGRPWMSPLEAKERTCESQSHKFKGPCVSQTNCASVCRTESFHGGNCRGLRRRCFAPNVVNCYCII